MFLDLAWHTLGLNPQPKISDERHEALTKHPDRPLYVIDVNSDDQSVLIKADEYHHFRALFETGTFDVSETYASQEQALRSVWDDPALDEYNDDEDRRSNS